MFLVGIATLLLAQAWLALRSGNRLALTAFVLIIVYWHATTLLTAPIFELARPGSLERTLVSWTIAICVEDFARTWFVARSAQKRIAVVTASLAFAMIVSLIETSDQMFGLMQAAAYQAFEAQANAQEGGGSTFSSYADALAVLTLCALKPFGHFALCIGLYYAWRLRSIILYTALVAAHLGFDLAIGWLPDYDPSAVTLMSLAIDVPFTAFLCISAYWIRLAARRREDGRPDGADSAVEPALPALD